MGYFMWILGVGGGKPIMSNPNKNPFQISSH